MKKLLLAIALLFPLLVLAEYNGVHVEFTIHLIDGEEIHAYKFLAHGENTEEYKNELETKPYFLLKNNYTYEPGEYGYYENRLKYKYNQSFIYRLLDPTEIDIDTIKLILITDLIISSYAIQIVSEHEWDDQNWMSSESLIQYSESEEMCSYDIFIHQIGAVPNAIIAEIKSIIHQADIEIKEKESNNTINSDREYEVLMNDIYNKRSRSLKPIFESHNNLKAVTISSCTC